jgi:DNA-binding NtrC family response regulator
LLISPVKLLWIADRHSDEIRRGLREFPDLALTEAAGAFEGLDQARTGDFDAILATVPLQGCSAEGLLDELQGTPVLVHSPEATVAEAVAWTKLGASQVFETGSGLSVALQAAIISRGRAPAVPSWRKFLVGQSRRIQEVAEIVRLIAPRRCTVLISGETGAGKEMIARAIHAASGRAGSEMVAVNCGALPETLLEAELFGHVKGAFTGAIAARVGRFEQAHGGTLFLDEIGDLPMPLQAKLLRVLQEREFQRLGSSETVRTDVRVIAASNVNLMDRIRAGQFREDLYYRLNVVPIAAPPLRERASDIPLLTVHFVEKICKEEGIAPKQISSEVLDRLMRYEWPGNVRQLENAVEMAIALSGVRRILCPSDFPLPNRAPALTPPSRPHHFIAVPDHGLDYEHTVGSIELNILEQALRKTQGNKKMAAEMLGLKRTTLAAKLKSLAAVAGAAAG